MLVILFFIVLSGLTSATVSFFITTMYIRQKQKVIRKYHFKPDYKPEEKRSINPPQIKFANVTNTENSFNNMSEE